MATDVDTVIIGAGVVGLAIARAVARFGREVIVLEAENAIGTGTSSRNSEVIHAGLYYEPGSRKARHCVRGRALLYDYCRARGIGFRRTGKLVVAHDESEAPVLEQILARGRANGVDDLVLIGAREMRRLEPELAGHAALHSPSSGILDTHGFMLSLLGEAEECGAALALNAPVLAGRFSSEGVTLSVGGADPMELTAACVINAAGLQAAAVAARFEAIDRPPPPMKFAKGNYFGLTGKVPFSHLIYPVPEPGGLGVHLTLDMAGRARFGPDVEWIGEIDFAVDPARAQPFYRAIRRYWPALPDGSLYPDYCGIRPKLAGGGSDFEIDTANGRMINLYGIESPGLTASLSLAEEVAALRDGLA